MKGKDEGVGEFVEIGGDNLSFSRILIEAGYWKSDALFAKNNRPTALTVIITDHDGNQTDHDVDVPTDMEPAVIDLGETTDVDSFKIIIKAVAKGKIKDTCISNVEIYDGDKQEIPFLESGAAAQDLLASLGDIDTALHDCDVQGLKTPRRWRRCASGAALRRPAAETQISRELASRGRASTDGPSGRATRWARRPGTSGTSPLRTRPRRGRGS